MLLIRKTQMKSLERAMLARFRATARAQLLGALPAGTPEERVDALLDHGLASATAAGMETEQQHLRFLSVMAALGPDFDRDPARPRLGETLRQGLPPWMALDRLEAFARGEDPDAEERAVLRAFAAPSPIEASAVETPEAVEA
ncbi:hypothetical protein HL658_22355 [Azospirillum sp. RWY-5-1]|uniref:Uncharacterized protein n=1 Tax=Azospirillum oleiclasticum TaxID=2735135 RepID=A0ABX2TDR4_9PROT|nr:hypothetical protein [Azospirillum oleiclasticum]NYZ15291.1 hypothetical protein [Azospirillum oleiclasticum]NYZ21288.1 hypothetical protein [Azospirillum oleiclasticum]